MLDGVQFPIRNLGGTQNQFGQNPSVAAAGTASAGTAGTAGTASPATYGGFNPYSNLGNNFGGVIIINNNNGGYRPPFPPPPPPPPPVYNGGGYNNNYGNNYNRGGYPGTPQRFPGFPPGVPLPPGFSSQGVPGQTIPGQIPGTGFEQANGVTKSIVDPNGPNVVVVDQTDIGKAGIDIDGDGRADRAHGQIVADDVRSKVSNANIATVELSDYEPQTLVNAFSRVAQQVDAGERVDAVNFSAQTFNKVADLAAVTGLPLDRNNIGQFKDEIRNRLFTMAQNPGAFGGDPAKVKEFTDFVPVIQSLDALTSRGVPVYVAAGNDGPDQINLFALASGAKVVGAVNAQGQKTDFTADNTLITNFAQGSFAINPITNQAGRIVGADFTGDGRRDIRASQLTGQGATFVNGREVSGTSFAAPTQLGDDLRARGFGSGISSLA